MNTEIHPVLKQLLDLGSSDQRAAPVAFAVYMDLAEVKAVWDLQYKFCSELDLIYITGKEKEADIDPKIYLPLSASQHVSAEWLSKVHHILPVNGRGVTLALKDADSTVVYYSLSEGLVSPESPEEAQNKKYTEEKRKFIQSELWRKRTQLYEMARNSSDIMIEKPNAGDEK